MISSGKSSKLLEAFSKLREADIVGHYFGVTSIPCVITNPLREDLHPSLAFYSPDRIHINYIDFGDKRFRGSLIKFMMKYWNTDFNTTIGKIVKEVNNDSKVAVNKTEVTDANRTEVKMNGKSDLECKIREWKDYDIEYWKSYGVPLHWLKWAGVYPISHKFIIRDGKRMTFKAEKYSYVFPENKDGRTTMKFYCPFNKNGFKWQNSHDKSVLGLWTKIPEKGKSVCICSSVKDALCLMANLYIPCICLQGEGYPISKTAMKELKRRFTDVYICLDNDAEGSKDAANLSEEHNIINVVIPEFEGGKDISDYYKTHGKDDFKNFFTNLFINAREDWYNELPF